MSAPVLVELCAGSAAVSLRWLHPRAKPPIAYQGGKRAYADAILLAMGLRPGGGQRDGRVVLVEAGPWGEAWAHWAAGGIPDTVDRLRAWAGEDPRALWTRLKDAPVPTERGERVSRWVILQAWNHGARCTLRPLLFNRSDAYGKPPLAGVRGETYPVTVERLIQRLFTLPDLSRVEVHHADARTVELIPGAHVYIDPDYEGTTGYGHTLPRPEVLALAERHRAAGCVVVVSEAEPLSMEGWVNMQPKNGGGGKGGISRLKQQREWLTMSEPPVGVLPFGQVAR